MNAAKTQQMERLSQDFSEQGISAGRRDSAAFRTSHSVASDSWLEMRLALIREWIWDPREGTACRANNCPRSLELKLKRGQTILPSHQPLRWRGLGLDVLRPLRALYRSTL